jgi:hypothetical protein
VWQLWPGSGTAADFDADVSWVWHAGWAISRTGGVASSGTSGAGLRQGRVFSFRLWRRPGFVS